MYQYLYLKTLDRLFNFFLTPYKIPTYATKHQTIALWDSHQFSAPNSMINGLYGVTDLSIRQQTFLLLHQKLKETTCIFSNLSFSRSFFKLFAFFRRHLLASAFPSGSFLSSTTEVQYVVNNINRMFKIIKWRIRMIENFLHILGP